MKKLLSLVLVLSLVLGSFGMVFAAPADVEGTSYADAAGKLSAVGVMGGYPDGTFRPEGNITRAEFAKVAVEAMGLGAAAEASQGGTQFSDVQGFEWFAGYVNVAANRGLINGYPDGTFRPQANMTNQEAMTILVRMAGLGPVVDRDGRWPQNYIGRAANEGILDGVSVAGPAVATRGNVAKLLVNTLEVPMWGASGYDADGKVNYGRLFVNNRNQTLLQDRLNITEVEGKVTHIARVDSLLEDNEIEIDGFNGTLTLVSNDSPEFLYGLDVKAWVNSDDEVVYVSVESRYFFDAVEVTKTNEIKLIQADRKFDTIAADDLEFTVDGKDYKLKVGDKFDYAKVVLNDRGRVEWVEAFDWNDFLVVDEVVGTDVIGYVQELDLEDYTIVKNGKAISIDDIVEGDILYFNEGEEYAEVFNRSITGKIDGIFTSSFDVNGRNYSYTAIGDYLDTNRAQYLDGSDQEPFDADAAEDMKDEGDVTIFLTRRGHVVFVDGNLGDSVTTSFYGLVVENTAEFTVRNTKYWNLDVMNENGKVVKFDIKDTEIDKASFFVNQHDEDQEWEDALKGKNVLVKVEIDSDGDVDKVTVLASKPVPATGFEVSDRYVAGNRLLRNAVVFLAEDYAPGYDTDDLDVDRLSEVDFEEVKAGTYYVNNKSEVVAVYVTGSDRGEDEEFYVVVNRTSQELSNEKQWRLRVWNENQSVNLLTKEGVTATVEDSAYEINQFAPGMFAKVTINDVTGEVTSVATVEGEGFDTVINSGKATNVNTGNRTFTLGDSKTTLELAADGYVFEVDGSSVKTAAFRDIRDEQVEVLMVEGSNRFVKYIVIK